jgi:hypothetical protein
MNSSSIFSFEKATNNAPKINNAPITVGRTLVSMKVKTLSSSKSWELKNAKTDPFTSIISPKGERNRMPAIADGIKTIHPHFLNECGNKNLFVM